jgi:hypothetical protein
MLVNPTTPGTNQPALFGKIVACRKLAPQGTVNENGASATDHKIDDYNRAIHRFWAPTRLVADPPNTFDFPCQYSKLRRSLPNTECLARDATSSILLLETCGLIVWIRTPC